MTQTRSDSAGGHAEQRRATEASSDLGTATGRVTAAALAADIKAFLTANALSVEARDGQSYLVAPGHQPFTWASSQASATLLERLGPSSQPRFYEETTTLLISFLISRFKPAAMIDAGAGVGYFARLAASHRTHAPKAYAFEMRADRLERFQGAIATDPFRRLITPVQAGLTDHHIGPQTIWTARSNLYEHEPTAAEYKEPWLLRVLHWLRGNTNRGLKSSTVLLTSIDHYCAQHDIAPGIIKIDVEGYEAKVLDGAQSVLKTARPLVILELHRDKLQRHGNTRVSVVERMFRQGYTALFLTDHHDRLACQVVEVDIDNPLFQRQETDLILFVPG